MSSKQTLLKLVCAVFVVWATGKPLVSQEDPKTTANSEATSAKIIEDTKEGHRTAPPGMVLISSSEFTMGTDDVSSFPNERPAHRVRVEGFWIDET